jgi:serine/threonine protein kinase
MYAVHQFGPYEILGQLSKGVGANVFLARTAQQERADEPKTDPQEPGFRLVCVKTLSEAWGKDEHLIEMFNDEGLLALQLRHPNCVATHKTGQIDGLRFIAMEYLSGLTLKDVIRDSVIRDVQLDDKLATSIVAKACGALDYAHNLVNSDGAPYNLIHRDICPHNVIITYDGVVKLMDFGVVKADTERLSTASGVVKGRFTYMSPEHISGGNIDRRSDIFSMGVLLYETLARRRFYEDSNPKAIARVLFQRKLARLSDVRPDCDPRLFEICNKSLQFSPKERFQTAEEMGLALMDVFSDQENESSHLFGIRGLMHKLVGQQSITDTQATLKQLKLSSHDPQEADLNRVGSKLLKPTDSIFGERKKISRQESIKAREEDTDISEREILPAMDVSYFEPLTIEGGFERTETAGASASDRHELRRIESAGSLAEPRSTGASPLPSSSQETHDPGEPYSASNLAEQGELSPQQSQTYVATQPLNKNESTDALATSRSKLDDMNLEATSPAFFERGLSRRKRLVLLCLSCVLLGVVLGLLLGRFLNP